MQVLFFSFFSVFVLFCSINVILNRNPIKSVFFLILTFIGTALIWLTLESEFLALTLILVYVGAVMVLFLFVVMMLNISYVEKNTKFGKMLFIGFILLFFLLVLIVYLYGYFLDINYYVNNIVIVSNDSTFNNIRELGVLLYTDFLMGVIIVGVLLLMGIVSAITLSLRKNYNKKDLRNSLQMESSIKNIKIL